MKNRIFIIVFTAGRMLAQNLDLGYDYSSGPYGGMAGAGIGKSDRMSAFDLNPAGVSGALSKKTVSCSQNIHYIHYSLFRHNQDLKSSRHSNSSIIFNWNALSYRFLGVLFGFPVTPKIPLTIGYSTRIAPYLVNTCRAITWSDLFDQSTSGSIGAGFLSTAIPVTERISLGMTFYLYSGKITSEIRGQNHGNDIHQWATLTSRFSGANLKAGILYHNPCFGVGLTLETPHRMRAAVEKELSSDGTYGYLFPKYDKTVWKMPLMLGMGFTLTGIQGCLLSFDYESRRYRESDIQFNLYEFGAPAQWGSVSIVRGGLECHPFHSNRIPLRLGYARIPQLYCSNHSTGQEHHILEYNNTNRNIKHLFALGSSFSWHQIEIDAGFEYSSIKWQRDLDTRFFIEDEYTEHRITFFTNLSMKIG